jgi:hypothetical protein
MWRIGAVVRYTLLQEKNCKISYLHTIKSREKGKERVDGWRG